MQRTMGRIVSSGSTMAASLGQPLNSFADTGLEPGLANNADLQAEVAQRAPQVGIDIKHLALNQLACGQQHPLLLAR